MGEEKIRGIIEEIRTARDHALQHYREIDAAYEEMQIELHRQERDEQVNRTLQRIEASRLLIRQIEMQLANAGESLVLDKELRKIAASEEE